MTDLFAAWNAAVQRSIDAYHLMPISSGHFNNYPKHPCQRCGRRTQAIDRICRGCKEAS